MIRPLQREDLPGVASLYEQVMRSGSAEPAPGLAAYLARTLLDHPWADPEIPSLVDVTADGAIVAFQGSSVRRALFDGGSVRIGCAGQLVAHPSARTRGAGGLLVRAYLAGPQELTITDGATAQMRRIWTALGGETSHLASIGWTRLLRPAAFAAERLAQRRGRRLPALAGAAGALDAGAARMPMLSPPPAPSAVDVEPLTPGVLLAELPALTRGLRLRLAYDEPFLTWLLAEMAAVDVRGTLIARLVRGREGGRTIGSYVYYLLPGAAAQVMQIAADPRDAGAVLDHLLHDAWAGGAVAVRGRVEAPLLEPLAERRALLRFNGQALVHARAPAILDAIQAGRSLLTRLDGEWWMGHHVLELGAGS